MTCAVAFPGSSSTRPPWAVLIGDARIGNARVLKRRNTLLSRNHANGKQGSCAKGGGLEQMALQSDPQGETGK